MPRVSVVIPTYNRPLLLERAIRSVLGQSFMDLELIVVQNGRVEASKELVQGYIGRGFPVRYIYDPVPDPVNARNTGIREAKGDYIAFLDDDDEWLPEKLAKQVAVLDKDPSIGLAGCQAPIFLDEKRSTHMMRKHSGFISFKRFLISGCVIRSLSCVIIRRDFFERFGGFRQDLPIANDYELYFRILQSYRIYMLPDELVRYHRHGSNMTTNVMKMCDETIKVLEIISGYDFEKTGVSKEFIRRTIAWRRKFWQARILHATAEEALDSGKYSLASQYLWGAVLKDSCIGLKLKWNRLRNPVYRFLRPYAVALYAASRSLRAGQPAGKA